VRWVAALLLAIPLLAATSAWAASPSKHYWLPIAQSNLIVSGQILLPPEKQGATDEWIQVRIRVNHVLKGISGADEITVRYFASEEPYAVSHKYLLALDKKDVLVFLVSATTEGKPDWYFLGENGVDLVNPQSVSEIRNEVARQQAVLRAWQPGPETKYTANVQRLVDQAVDAKEEQNAFRDLEGVGMGGVPALIEIMDDRRPLPIPAISLRNPPGAFEGLRHYGPKTVVDALAAILNQITFYDFGFIYSGGSDEERARAVAGWRVYSDILRNHPAMLPPK